MHLIALDEAINFNTTSLDALSLSSIVLLSFAYHPVFSNLIYLFYGSTSMAAYG